MSNQTLGIKFLNPLPINININFGAPPPQPTPPEIHGVFTWQQGDFIFRGENMANTMQAGSKAKLSVQWVDKFNNPAKVDGPTAWDTTDDTIATFTPDSTDPNALSGEVESVGPIGTVQIQATADADMGAGTQSITAICDISVIAGEASGGTITFTPEASSVKTLHKKK